MNYITPGVGSDEDEIIDYYNRQNKPVIQIVVDNMIINGDVSTVPMSSRRNEKLPTLNKYLHYNRFV